MSEISNLEPRAIWEQFDAITKIPRPSKKESKIRDYLVAFAQRHDLECKCDDIGNVVMRKPATAGFEKYPAVALQAHMDMVCEKNSDVQFDFDTDPIDAYIDGEWVRARGTTLGADCGIGMAAALAALTADGVEHGPLEALFTVDEETGLTGAFELGDGMLSAHYLINLDSEDEGELFIGCAGGIDTTATFTCRPQAAPAGYKFYRIDVADLKGGHSGDNINDGLANSNKLVARFLWMAMQQPGLRLSYFCGGNLRNAIPREAYAIFGVPETDAKRVEQLYAEYATEIKAEYALTEPGMTVTLSASAADTVIDEETQSALVYSLVGVPNGVLAMSYSIPGLVETSSNLASVKFTDENTIVVTSSQRSSVESGKYYAMSAVDSVFTLAGAVVEHSDGYPGWTPNPKSQLLDVCRSCYHSLFGQDPKVRAIHAGLECGLFLEKYPALEMVSFGPTLRGVHSPDERLEIATVDKFWRLLTEVLRMLS